MKKYVNSYDKNAPTPREGSIWVWELDKPGACELIEVLEVKWNGEEWWVTTGRLHGIRNPDALDYDKPVPNDLSRFWEAVTPVRR